MPDFIYRRRISYYIYAKIVYKYNEWQMEDIYIMKKFFLIKMLAYLLSISMVLSACKIEIHPEVSGLTSEQVLKIRQAYFEFRHGKSSDGDLNEIFITKYLGVYNGNIAIKISDGNLTESIESIWSESTIGLFIDGVYIGNPDKYESYYLYVESASISSVEVMFLEVAYSQGYIDKEDLKKIAELEE